METLERNKDGQKYKFCLEETCPIFLAQFHFQFVFQKMFSMVVLNLNVSFQTVFPIQSNISIFQTIFHKCVISLVGFCSENKKRKKDNSG